MELRRQFFVTLTQLFTNKTIPPTSYTDELDEEKLYRSGVYHQVIPLIYHFQQPLKQAFPSISDNFWARARLFTLFNDTFLIAVEKTLSELDNAFQQHKIAYRLFKGPVLAYQSYQFPYLRTFGDIDILIKPAHLPQTHNILQDLGFELCNDLYSNFPDHIIQKYAFARHYQRRQKPQLALDIHLNLSGGLHPFQFDITEFWAHSAPITIDNHTYETFEPVYQAIIALYHAFKHYFFKLIWFFDLWALLKTPNFDYDRFESLIRHFKLQNMWQLFNQFSAQLCNYDQPLHRSWCTRLPLSKNWLNLDRILSGILPLSPSKARLILPLFYLPNISSKGRYLWRQLLPPREVIRDFYLNSHLQPTLWNYLRLRRKAIAELFNDQ